MFNKLSLAIVAEPFNDTKYGTVILDSYRRKQFPYEVFQAEVGALAPYYIVPSGPVEVPVTFLNQRPTTGTIITMGFRTPAAEEASKTGFLFDFSSSGYSGYFFFRPDSKKFALRVGSSDKVEQTAYPLEASTDYHIAYHFRNNAFAIYVNGTLLVTGPTSTGFSEASVGDTLRLFHNPRYGDHHHIPSRFYYFYVFNSSYSEISEQKPLDAYYLQTGFVEKTVATFYHDNSSIIEAKGSVSTYVNTPYKTVISSNAITFNNEVKYRYPSGIHIHLYNPVNQTTLASCVPNPDGSFKMYYKGTLSATTLVQLLTIDLKRDYSSLIINM